MNKQMPKRLTINGAEYIRVDLAQNQKNQNRQPNLTSAINTIDGQNGITIKIFTGNDNQNRRSRNRRQGKNNRAQ